MKIAMTGHKHIPSREGGIEIVVEELSVRMAERGHEVTCYNRSCHRRQENTFDNWDQTEYKGIKLETVPTVERRGLAAASSSFFSAIKASFQDYDVIHFHAEGPCAALWIPKLLGKRCIATIHGLDHQRAKWGKFARIYILLGEKTAVRFADEIIVLSKDMQRYFQKNYHRKTVLIPNGITLPAVKHADIIRQKWDLKKNDYILYLGRLVPEKGLQYLIRAFQTIQTDKKLVIAGGSSDTDDFVKKLKNMAKDDERILFTGFVQGQVLDELYSNAFFYTLPSDLEGMPLSLLEAMSYGNCCLVSDIPECTDVVEDKAVTFQKGNIEDLADKLQMLCGDTCKVAHYKKEAAEFICKKYNWEPIVDQTLKLYAGEETG